MVTKMKMFGFFTSNTSSTARVDNNTNKVKATSSSQAFNMKNLTSLMNIKSSGCKSCRG